MLYRKVKKIVASAATCDGNVRTLHRIFANMRLFFFNHIAAYKRIPRSLASQPGRDALSGQHSALTVAKAGKGYARRLGKGVEHSETEGCIMRPTVANNRI